MAKIENIFVTRIYSARLSGQAARRLNEELAAAALQIASDDVAGQRWSEENRYPGYTSYASLNDLTWRSPEFGDLARHLDEHVADFVKELDFDLGGRPLQLDSLWINVLEPGGAHPAHIHPHSVISGTYYVEVPDGAGAIRFEDPRLGLMMASPPRRKRADRVNRPFITMAPRPGMLLLWESWLRHDVPINESESERISISFNYGWGEG